MRWLIMQLIRGRGTTLGTPVSSLAFQAHHRRYKGGAAAAVTIVIVGVVLAEVAG